jgi:hypothetical protein
MIRMGRVLKIPSLNTASQENGKKRPHINQDLGDCERRYLQELCSPKAGLLSTNPLNHVKI